MINNMGPSGLCGTLKTESLQELAQTRQNHQKFQFYLRFSALDDTSKLQIGHFDGNGARVR